MREIRTYGSVRGGARSNPRPYRDRNSTFIRQPVGHVIVSTVYLPQYDPTHEINPGVGAAFMRKLWDGFYACSFGRR